MIEDLFLLMFLFCFVVELLRSKDNDLRKILDEKSKLVAELRVKLIFFVLVKIVIYCIFPKRVLVVTACKCSKSHADN